ncbi:MAG: hypothetical protein WA020_15080, partial [Candidatus Acidiferrales bacterium]
YQLSYLGCELNLALRAEGVNFRVAACVTAAREIHRGARRRRGRNRARDCGAVKRLLVFPDVF